MQQLKIILLSSIAIFGTCANAESTSVNMAPIISYLLSDTASSSDNVEPIADAGIDQDVKTTSVVTLDGSASSDADGDTLTYAWSIISSPPGSDAELSYVTTVNPTFVADLTGSYVIQLIVNDGTVNSVANTVTITASYLDHPPPPPES